MRITLEELPSALADLERTIAEKIEASLASTAERAVEPIKERVPVAFGELQKSVHALHNPPRTVMDAPHAVAVEEGSEPFRPDFQKLKAWVELKELPPAATTFISRKIEREGLPPHWPVRESLADIRVILDTELQIRLKR